MQLSGCLFHLDGNNFGELDKSPKPPCRVLRDFACIALTLLRSILNASIVTMKGRFPKTAPTSPLILLQLYLNFRAEVFKCEAQLYAVLLTVAQRLKRHVSSHPVL
jgi:hypothetical protein